jgi:chitinase
MGVSPKKLVVGIPLYGRMMSITSAGEHKGLYQPITGTPQGEWDNIQSGFTGLLDYRCIIDDTGCGNQFKRPALTFMQPLRNNEGYYAKTPWGYAENLFLTFDDATSAAYKSNWAKNKGLVGVMLWDCSGDVDTNDKRSIIGAISVVYSQRPRM